MHDGNEIAGVLTLLVVGAIGLYIYFLPAIIAYGREHHNFIAIFALNLTLGWSLVGWVVALIWALAAPASVKITATPEPAPSPSVTPVEIRVACPFCAEKILVAAKVCKHCGRDVLPAAADDGGETS